MSGALVPLRLGPLQAPGFTVLRSGIRWLHEDGHLCRPGEAVAFCNIGLAATEGARADPPPFAGEDIDMQVVLAPRRAGRLRRSAHSSLGGYLDKLYFHPWAPDFVIGHLEPLSGEQLPGLEDGEALQLLMLTGRRFTEVAADLGGLMTGWHDRRRGWWGGGDGPLGTLLSLGICEQAGIVGGDRFAFFELFKAASGPAHVVHIPDESLVPSAPVLLDQLRRTEAQCQEISEDFATSFFGGSVVPSPRDWLFAGALLAMLLRSPLTDRYDVLMRSGFRRTGSADAVLLSVLAETSVVLRHRRLGYHLSFHDFHVHHTGPAVQAWLRTQFEPVKRTPDAVRRDLRALIDETAARSDMRFLVLNALSSSGYEEVHSYVPFDRPIGGTLASVRNKELNLMLCDLARERDISIVDVDLIAAEMGAQHAPDGVHQSGALQDEVRAEMLHILRARHVPGFVAPISSAVIA
jgi:hypothetical protein